MATRYTAKLHDDTPQSFEEFAWECARAMGALIMMREESNDAAIELSKPSDFHLHALNRAKAEITEISSLSQEVIEARIKRQYDSEVESHKKIIKEKQACAERYNAMLDQVRAWHPPTSDHYNFKKFMDNQLTNSLDLDCDVSYYNDPTMESAEEWVESRLIQLKADVVRHTEAHEAEIKRVNGRNEWVTQLSDSIPIPGYKKGW